MNQKEVIVVVVIVFAFVGTIIAIEIWKTLTEHGEAVMSDFKEANSIEDVDQRIEAQNAILDRLKLGDSK